MTSTQLQCTKKGGPFEIAAAKLPALSSDDVLIRLKATAINPVDVKKRDYGIRVPQWPVVLGIEGVGVVEQVGSNVHNVKSGDEVIAFVSGDSNGGTYQESVIVNAKMVVKKPANVSFEDAASIIVCYATAATAINGAAKIPLPLIEGGQQSGPVPKSVLVLGGSSGVGVSTIQLLKAAYPDLPVYATSSSKHHARLTTLGVDENFDYQSLDLVGDLKKALPDQGVDVIIDCVGSGAKETNISSILLADGSRKYIAIIVGAPFEVGKDVQKHDVDSNAVSELVPGAIPSLTRLLEQGQFKVPFAKVKVVGHGLQAVVDHMDEVMKASGEKLIVTL